jgi:enoyl-CoA hydratase
MRMTDIHVIILQGAGRAFCSGYDLKDFAEADVDTPCTQSMPWDPMVDYRDHEGFHRRLLQPLAQPQADHLQGAGLRRGRRQRHRAVLRPGGDGRGCADRLHAGAGLGLPDHRDVGLPPRRRKAKRMLLTGDTIDGRTAKEWGLVIDAVPEAELEGAVLKLANRMAGVPKNQLMMQKLMINQAYDNMGLANTQMIATLFDGITRHSPEGQWFKHYAEEKGYKEAVRLRDSGEPIPGSKTYKGF